MHDQAFECAHHLELIQADQVVLIYKNDCGVSAPLHVPKRCNCDTPLLSFIHLLLCPFNMGLQLKCPQDVALGAERLPHAHTPTG